MKKHLLLPILLLSMFVSGQELEQPEKTNFNEIKLNGLYLVLGALDITYEYTLNEESAFGVNVFLPIDKNVNDDINYYISPYYRRYFGKKHAAGFFVEGFGMLNSVDREIDFIFEDDEEDWRTDFALGIGLGGKWITARGFIGELGFGVGRNLFHSDTDSDFIGKVAITLGFRF